MQTSAHEHSGFLFNALLVFVATPQSYSFRAMLYVSEKKLNDIIVVTLNFPLELDMLRFLGVDGEYDYYGFC